MKISCIQFDMSFASPEENFQRVQELIRQAAKEGCDTCLLPETWNTGYFPKDTLASLCDRDGETVKNTVGGLAKELSVNIVAGSVANMKNGKIYNTCYVFDRQGNTVCEYDKTHLFTPMNEDHYFTAGNNIRTFRLDGALCGAIICYDVRFPELIRTMTTSSDEHLCCMFLMAQWPLKRLMHLQTLSCARAIENQMFLACCNSPATVVDTVFAGHSAIYGPFGDVLSCAAGGEEIISAECDFSEIEEIAGSINVFRDRRSELYNIK